MRYLTGFAAAAFLSLGAHALPAAAQSAPGTVAVPLRLNADVVTSARQGKGVQGAICVAQSVFAPGDTIIFRAVVTDANNVPLTQDQLTQRGIKVVVTTGEGATIPLVYEQHPPPNIPVPKHDLYFAAAYPISHEHPTGTLTWTAAVTDNAGHSITFAPIGQVTGVTTLQIVAKGDPASAK
jgi:hypothetical protein